MKWIHNHKLAVLGLILMIIAAILCVSPMVIPLIHLNADPLTINTIMIVTGIIAMIGLFLLIPEIVYYTKGQERIERIWTRYSAPLEKKTNAFEECRQVQQLVKNSNITLNEARRLVAEALKARGFDAPVVPIEFYRYEIAKNPIYAVRYDNQFIMVRRLLWEYCLGMRANEEGFRELSEKWIYNEKEWNKPTNTKIDLMYRWVKDLPEDCRVNLKDIILSQKLQNSWQHRMDRIEPLQPYPIYDSKVCNITLGDDGLCPLQGEIIRFYKDSLKSNEPFPYDAHWINFPGTIPDIGAEITFKVNNEETNNTITGTVKYIRGTNVIVKLDEDEGLDLYGPYNYRGMTDTPYNFDTTYEYSPKKQELTCQHHFGKKYDINTWEKAFTDSIVPVMQPYFSVYSIVNGYTYKKKYKLYNKEQQKYVWYQKERDILPHKEYIWFMTMEHLQNILGNEFDPANPPHMYGRTGMVEQGLYERMLVGDDIHEETKPQNSLLLPELAQKLDIPQTQDFGYSGVSFLKPAKYELYIMVDILKCEAWKCEDTHDYDEKIDGPKVDLSNI